MNARIPIAKGVESGLDGVGPLSWGAHICHVYTGAHDLSQAVIPFLRAGLDRGERCVWVASRPLDASKARTMMARAIPALARYEARTQIQISWPWEVLPSGPPFDPRRTAEAWLTREEHARRDGFAGLRIAQCASAFDAMGPEALAAYEAMLHRSIEGRRILALCAYPLERCTSGAALDGALCHDYAVLEDGESFKALESATALVGACHVRSSTLEATPTIPNRHSQTRVRTKRRSTSVDVNDRLARLQRATAALSPVHDTEELLDAVVRAVCPVLGSTAAFAAGVELEGGATRVVCRTTSDGDGEGFFDSRAQVEAVVQLEQPLWLHDPEEISISFERRSPALRALAAIPFDIGSLRKGVVVFGFPQERNFGVSARALIRDVANQVGLTVERLLLHDHLERQHRRLERESRLKDDFLAMLGHELRNPLASIRTAAALLRRGELDAARIEQVTRILDRRTEHMARLVDGLLDVSRMQRGKIELRFETVDLRRILDEGIEEHRSRVDGKAVAIVADIGESPVWVDADPVRLMQVVDNLLSNAVRYTDPGGTVTVTLRRLGGEAEIRVHDDGAGIDPEVLPHIFEAFQQGPKQPPRESGGLGLGLSLVQSIVDRHGGRVCAESEGLGRGATFRIWLPSSHQVARPKTPMPEAERAKGRRILVVEDDFDMSMLLAEVLADAGHDVEVAEDAASAIEAARRRPPDVLLCDIGLPGDLNGYDVASALRAEPHSPSLMVALTGFGREEDVECADRAGFDVHLTKPVDMAALEALLERRSTGD